MKDVARKYPADPEAQTLYAESQMDLSPWNYWEGRGTKARPGTQDVITTLERTLKKYPDHLGACHFYIHIVEASTTPGRALPCADRIAQQIPGAGHLVHMPSHIYMRVGYYDRVVNHNHDAVAADQAYVQDQSDQLVAKTQEFVDLYKAGDDDAARALYPVARTHWERIETVAESFGDLDPKMDAREADLEEGQEWTGWHRIEKDLWPQEAEDYTPLTDAERATYADDLMKNTEILDGRHERPRGLLDVVGEALDGVRARERVHGLGHVRLEGEHLLGAQRQPSGLLGR